MPSLKRTNERRKIQWLDPVNGTEYTILEAPMPIEFIHAGIQVTADDGCSRVVWDTTVAPDAFADMFSPIYQEGLNNLKVELEA